MPVRFSRYEVHVAAHPATAEAARALAERDIAEGRLRFVYCLPLHCYSFHDWAGEFDQLLRERLGVEARAVIDFPYSDPNEIGVFQGEHYLRMKQEVERRFGAGVLETLELEARQLHAANRKARLADVAG
jgi:hypothetical protein